MDDRFPTKLVLLLVADTFDGDYAGYNAYNNMAIHPDFDSESDRAGLPLESLLVHEVAHYYWSNSAETWLDEGAAEIMTVIYTESHTEYRADRDDFNLPCSIPDLQSLERLRSEAPADCVYSLGPQLFLDLYRALGPDDFQRGFHALYVSGRDARWPKDWDARDIGDLREAFNFSAQAVDEIIPQWHEGSQP